MYKNQNITVVMPALDEEASIANVIHALWQLKNSDQSNMIDRIIVCDNNSSDATAEVAQSAGADVVSEVQQGYGAACLKALSLVDTTDIIVFVDADRSVIVEEIIYLLDGIMDGYDLAIGSRTLGYATKGSLTPQQRFGNSLASFLIRLIWKQPVTDLGPFRAVKYASLQHLNMQDRRYGWTVEMQVKAIQSGIRIVEKPVSSIRRIGRSKISGTLLGTLAAGHGIIGMIFKLWWKEKVSDITKSAKTSEI